MATVSFIKILIFQSKFNLDLWFFNTVKVQTADFALME